MAGTPSEIDVRELAAWRREGRPHGILDVREPWELEICRIEGALAIPLQELPARLDEVPRDRPLVVICHHGARSERAVSWLHRMGAGNAVNLEGGIDAWAREVDPTMGVY